MIINYGISDRSLVRKKLDEAGIRPTPKDTDDVLKKVESAFIQQFESEVEYMINDLTEGN